MGILFAREAPATQDMNINGLPTKMQMMEVEFGKKDLELTHRWPENNTLEDWSRSAGNVRITHINYKASMGWGLETIQFLSSNGVESQRAG